ncbi:MAG: protein phosphatase 2C domain-containing protein [Spirosoma sp.]|nr:protein phosphatase 2C domain-containing protein [Spirosoma sp.]
MDVRIARPLGYSELGNRGNNEDALYPDPQHTSARQRWFLVCDGVGGAERGEIASKLAVTALDTYFHRHPVTVVTEAYVQEAVAHVEDQFNQYLTTNPQAAGMATTMTMLYLHEAGATVAHIGDSRVYQIREGSIIWCTDDHSYVNELVKAGVLSAAEAQKHPQRNIITRALQGGEKGVKASVQILNDLRAGDYFFLCSDGVLERVSDELLENTLRDRADTNEQKMARLHGYSLGNTRDNFTAYLIQIEQVTGAVEFRHQVAAPVYERSAIDTDHGDAVTLINMPIPDAVKSPAPPEPPAPVAAPARPAPQPQYEVKTTPPLAPRNPVRPAAPVPVPARRSSPWLTVVLVLIGLALAAGGWYFWQQYNHKNDSTELPLSSQPPARKSIPVEPVDQVGEDLTVPSESNPPETPEPSPATASADLPASDAKSTDDVVKTVGDDLKIVRDKDTGLLGLRTADGQWTTARHYSKIGDFDNGVARVETSKGPEKYISKDGKTFSRFEDYQYGIATLTDVDGHKLYLSKGGNWLDEVKSPSNQRIAVRQNQKWGYLNMNGQVSNFIQYEKAGPFDDDGTAEVVLNGKAIRIDKEGKPSAKPAKPKKEATAKRST